MYLSIEEEFARWMRRATIHRVELALIVKTGTDSSGKSVSSDELAQARAKLLALHEILDPPDMRL